MPIYLPNGRVVKSLPDYAAYGKLDGWTSGMLPLGAGAGVAPTEVAYTEWIDYTPTLTNITKGNGTLVARYKQTGKTIELDIRFTLGSTSAISGIPGFSLPVTAARVGSTAFAALQDAGYATFAGYAIVDTTTQMNVYCLRADATYLRYDAISATVPMTWTTNDAIFVTLFYEVA